MEKFLNKSILVRTCLGGMDGSGLEYKGTLTSYDDEYICLDERIYVVRKFIITIMIK